MEPTFFEKIREIVADALERPAGERDVFIEHACAGDDELRREVESLIEMDAHASGGQDLLADSDILARRDQLERIIDDRTGTTAGGPASPIAGTRSQSTLRIPDGSAVGRYTITGVLGEGGMGLVYRAEQKQPRRDVALKLIRPGYATPRMLRRFEVESEVLARLTHPGIAQVFDAGVAETVFGSQPYFAMELIAGEPVTAFAQTHSLGTRERLGLIASIADAVEHAHQRGVIHRDLKPGNILVGADRRPRVLDFGVARATDADINTTTMRTDVGMLVGTLAYMSPEQASGDPDTVDTRSDVYSLGMVAFELLAGVLPYSVEGTMIHEAVTIIRDASPSSLSTADRSLRGDIETVIGKALEKDKDRRYQAAADLAADIRRYLASEPISARPPSAFYQLRKFSRRNKALVLGAAALITSLAVGVVFSMYFAFGERQQRHLADARELLARKSSAQASYGLLSSALFFADEGRPWMASELLYTVPETNRGWVWKHIGLRTPWILEVEQNVNSRLLDVVRPAGFLNETDMLLYTRGGTISRLNLITGQETPIVGRTDRDAPPLKRFSWSSAPENTAALLSGNTGLVIDATMSNAVPNPIVPPINPAFPGEVVSFSEDRSLAGVHSYNLPKMTFYDQTGEVFFLDSGWEAGSGRNWFFSHFLRSRPYVIANRFSGYLYVVDTRTWEVVRELQIPAGNHHLGMGVLPDESAAYFSTENGIELRSLPELALLDTRAAEYGGCAQVRLSSAGRYLSASYPEEQTLRVFDTQTWDPIFEHDTQQTWLQWDLHFAPNGRLLNAPSPDHGGPWIIDPEEPPGSHITVLDDHESRVNQLAVSADGNLLATAAPEGDVLLWDLTRGHVLARFERNIDYLYNIDAPLAFSPDGSSLIFAEQSSDEATGRRHTLRIVNLLTGDGTTAVFATRDELMDDLAERFMPVAPCPLYRNAALLPDGRLLTGTADPNVGYGVRVRATGEDAVLLPRFAGLHTTAGLAVSPDGSTAAVGEYLTVRIRDALTLEILHEITDAQTGRNANRPLGMTYSPDGSLLAIGTELGEVMVYETEFFQKICDVSLPKISPEAERNEVFSLLWTPDGSRLISTTGKHIRILESERYITREHRVHEWTQLLDAAREAAAQLEARPNTIDPGAWRVAMIERWAADAGSEQLSDKGEQ